MEDTKYCIYCGAPLSGGSAQCPRCGKVQEDKENLVKPHTTKVACFLLPMWHFAESVSL